MEIENMQIFKKNSPYQKEMSIKKKAKADPNNGNQE